jgi:hypothetical protein
VKTPGGTEMSNLRKVAESKVNEPMNSWPLHNDFHRKNLHPFSGSKYGELYWDEECLRCQLERVASEKADKPSIPFKDIQVADR